MSRSELKEARRDGTSNNDVALKASTEGLSETCQQSRVSEKDCKTIMRRNKTIRAQEGCSSD